MLYASRYLLIFGGMADNEVFNDFYIMDCYSFEWKKIKIMSNKTLPFCLDPRMEYLANRGFMFLG